MSRGYPLVWSGTHLPCLRYSLTAGAGELTWDPVCQNKKQSLWPARMKIKASWEGLGCVEVVWLCLGEAESFPFAASVTFMKLKAGDGPLNDYQLCCLTQMAAHGTLLNRIFLWPIELPSNVLGCSRLPCVHLSCAFHGCLYPPPPLAQAPPCLSTRTRSDRHFCRIF